MTEPLVLHAAHTPAAAAPLPAVWSCCSDICVRVQAIWEAFCKCAAEWIIPLMSWCELQIHGPGKPLEIPESCDDARIIHPTLAERQAQHEKYWILLANVFDSFLLLTGIRGYVRPSLPIEERLGKIRECILSRELMLYAAHAAYRPEFAWELDYLQVLLQLGGDPNRRSDTYDFTPLHYAVLSGSRVAYEQLRVAGAFGMRCNPEVAGRASTGIPRFTPLELAYEILRYEGPPRTYFEKEVTKKMFPGVEKYVPLWSKVWGERDEIEAIIRYEIDRALPYFQEALGHMMSRPLCGLITEYYLSGEPSESGRYLIDCEQGC